MTKPKPLPPIQRLRELFEVTENGDLLWKISPNNFVAVGQNAGTVASGGYYQTWVDGKICLVHRIVWAICTGTDPVDFQIDHINGDRQDNRLLNLRLATHGQNALNRKQHKVVSSTGATGVYYCPRNTTRPYIAKASSKYLGAFATMAEAIEARALALCKYAGAFNPENRPAT